MCDGFIRKDNWDIPGNDILSSPVHQPDYASCCFLCQATYGCSAFSYSVSSQQCSLKARMGSAGNSTDGKITGYNPNMCGSFIRKDNWDIPGNDILSSPVHQPDYASCCSQCQATNGCIAFSYSPSSQQCSLKTSIGGGRNSTDDNIIGYYFHPLRGPSTDIHPNTQWQENGLTVAGGNGPGSSLNQLYYPWGLYVDDNETIYVADYENHRIMKWERNATSGQVVAGGNGPGNRSDQLNHPYDVIVDKERDRIFICDYVNKRVVQWPLLHGKSGETIISDMDCWGLTMDEQGSLYVVDPEKYKVKRFKIGDTKGTLIAGGNGQGNALNQFDHPRFIFVDQDYSAYVSEWKNRVTKWMNGEESGILVAGGTEPGNGLGQLSLPKGVVVDHSFTLYVVDSGNNRIMRWPKGATEGSIIIGENGGGGGSNQLTGFGGLSFDRDGNLYVVDNANHRVQKFKIEQTQNDY
ncbi:unnamed protein product [Rotaria sordida]|uniref:Apple domain-containing protein n=1 Tax=Rotaria sordida TaxID=392033 RepID=A0A815PRL6_9BILA|nr:unnamed protein product [Rotaria sordida]CAF1452524.1 unnamed protein product [Rotaria sordida]